MPPSLRKRARRALLASAVLAISLAAPAALGTAAAGATAMPAVQAHFMWSQYELPEVYQQMDQAKAAGAQMLRVDVGWASIEADAKGSYNDWYLNKLDSVVAAAKARGIKLLLTLWQTPCWASSAPETLKQSCSGSWWDRGVELYPPANPQDYADALAWMVRRYGDGVAAWEVWNEPNDGSYLKGSDPVGSYAAMLKAAYPAAKAADPNTTIVGGSLASADYDFTQKLLSAGVKNSFDGWSVHPYSEDRSPLTAIDPQWAKASFIQGVPAVHDTLQRNGVDKPLWLTEFGWSDCNVRGAESWQNCVDSSTQADYIRQAFHQMRSWSYVAAGVYFNLENTGTDPSDQMDNYGLLRADGSRKPAFAAFQDAAADLAGGALPDSSSGSTNPTGSGSGRGKAARKRIRLKLSRKHGRVYASGRAPRRAHVQLVAYRYDNRHHHYRRLPSFHASVAANAKGTFRKRLPSRKLHHGRWRITALADQAVRATRNLKISASR